MKKELVIIVGAGTSGLSTSACLKTLSIPHIILEREDCFGSLWKRRVYDRLHLHLAKKFCELPHKPFPKCTPLYVPKENFVQYLEDYVLEFDIKPLYSRSVELAEYKSISGEWYLQTRNRNTGETEEYSCRFLVIASGENSEAFVPKIRGLDEFKGMIIHSTHYKSGKDYKDKSVLVVGCGNSGMEIADDLVNFGANTSIVIRNPFHVQSRFVTNFALVLFSFLPFNMVDTMMVMLSKLQYGDLSKYGIIRPDLGPFHLKHFYGKYPVIDAGTISKMKSGKLKVLPSIESITSTKVSFINGESHPFDAIIFATGFKRSTHKWLKDDNEFLNEDGIPKQTYPDYFKGKNGIYCVGLSRKGFYGASADAISVANDIKKKLPNDG